MSETNTVVAETVTETKVETPVETKVKPTPEQVAEREEARRKAAELVAEAELAQENRRREAELAAETKRLAAELEAQKAKRPVGRPEKYVGQELAHIVLLLQRYGLTGTERRLKAVGGDKGTELEKQWRKDSITAWNEVGGKGKAPIHARISKPTLASIGGKAQLTFKAGRPKVVA